MNTESPKTEASSPSRRTLLFKIAKYALMVGLIAYLGVSHKSELADFLDFAIQSHPLGWAAIAAFITLGLVCFTLRQRLMLKIPGASIPFGLLFKIAYAGMFVNNYLPAGLGTDVCRLAYLRGGKLRTSELGAWVLTDKIIGLAGIIGLGILVFLAALALEVKGVADNPSIAYLLLSSLVVATLALAPFVLARWKRAVDLFAALGERRFKRGEDVRKAFGLFDLYGRRKALLLGALLLAVINHLAMVLGVCVVAWMFGGLENAMVALVCAPLVMLSNAVPATPGNVGWTEAVASSLWGLFGFEGGLSIFLMWRIICMVYSFGGGLIWLRLRKATEAEPCAE